MAKHAQRPGDPPRRDNTPAHGGRHSQRSPRRSLLLAGSAGAVALLVAFAAGWWQQTASLPEAPQVGADRSGSATASPSPAPDSAPPSTATSTPGVTTAPPSASPATPGRRATSSVRAERPQMATLPSGKKVPIKAVTTRRNGQLDVPDDIRTAGWWRGGARLGDPFGSTLLAAHVDSRTQGLGPYAELLTVRKGARIVLFSAHLRQTFAVTSLQLIGKDALPKHPSVYSAGGARRLVLVTCAPPYIKAEGGYQRLAIVTARPVAAPGQKGQ